MFNKLRNYTYIIHSHIIVMLSFVFLKNYLNLIEIILIRALNNISII
jgi:hypothetical protein